MAARWRALAANWERAAAQTPFPIIVLAQGCLSLHYRVARWCASSTMPGTCCCSAPGGTPPAASSCRRNAASSATSCSRVLHLRLCHAITARLFRGIAELAESAPLQPFLERRQLRRRQRRRHARRGAYNGGLQPQAMLRNTSWQVISTRALFEVCCRFSAGYEQPLPAAAPLRRRPPQGPLRRRPWLRPRVPAGLRRNVAAAPARPTTLCILLNWETLQNSQYCTYDCGAY